MNRFVFSLFISLVIGLFGFLCCENRENRLLKKEMRALEVRLAQSEERMDTFWIHDSIPVTKVKVVEVDKTDYRKQLADKETIRELGLKVKQLESENRTLLATRDTVFLSPLNDSVYVYKDNWVLFKYLVNERVLDYSVRDSLSTYVAREFKHRFLWWRWGTKGYSVFIVSHNPKSRVEYSKFIKIK
jgi:hypothetical protein